jgi:hypothetical protein
MIELFFVLLFKGQLYEIMYSLSTCCGGRSLAVYSKIHKIRKPGFTLRDPSV